MLLDIDNQALEVLALRVVDIYRVVGRLGKLTDDAHLTLGDSCRGEDCGAEQVAANSLRAREGKEDTSRANLLQRTGINLLVALQRIAQNFVVLGKGWRVKDNKVVAIVDIFQILNSICGDCLVWRIIAEV